MPLDYRRDDARRRIYVTATDPLVREDWIATTTRQATEGTWSYGLLYDGTARQEVSTPEDALQLVQLVGKLTMTYGRRGPVAFVLCDPDLERQGKRYAALGKLTALKVGLFRSIDDAEEWLTRETPL